MAAIDSSPCSTPVARAFCQFVRTGEDSRAEVAPAERAEGATFIDFHRLSLLFKCFSEVYQKQQAEQQAEERRLREAGRKELQIQQVRWRHEQRRELQQKQQMLAGCGFRCLEWQDHAAKEREAEALRDARELWKEELKRRLGGS